MLGLALTVWTVMLFAIPIATVLGLVAMLLRPKA